MGSSPPAIQLPWPDLNRQYPDSMPGVFLLHYRGFQRTGKDSNLRPGVQPLALPLSYRSTCRLRLSGVPSVSTVHSRQPVLSPRLPILDPLLLDRLLHADAWDRLVLEARLRTIEDEFLTLP